MARTKICIEIESSSQAVITTAAKTLIEHSRGLLSYIADAAYVVNGAQLIKSITHDGKDVTEVIQ
jgi:hypothetical protein